MNEYFENIKELTHLIRNYGVELYVKHGGSLENPNPYEFCKFCNKGFKLAQLKVIKLLRQENDKTKEIKENYKLERSKSQSNKEELEKLRTEIKLAELRETLLRHVMDSIAWQLYGGKREIIARYYLEEEGYPSITDQGFEATLSLANKINSDPSKFALITDLTENIQIGDIHIWTPEGIELLEVKTGEKNRIAIELLGFYDLNNLKPKERVEKIDDINLKEQMQRILKQKGKMQKTVKILKEGVGEYQKNDESKVRLHESLIQQETHHHEIIAAIQESKERGWGYRCVGAITHIGAYRGHYRFGGGKETLLKCTNGYPVYDIRGSTGITIGEPIFCKPFPEEMIHDIITNEVIVYIGLDLDNIIKFGNDFGGSFRWSSKKELHEARELSPLKARETIDFKNRGIIICETKNGKGFMGSGLLCRLVYDHLDPWIELANRIITCHKLSEEKSSEEE